MTPIALARQVCFGMASPARKWETRNEDLACFLGRPCVRSGKSRASLRHASLSNPLFCPYHKTKTHLAAPYSNKFKIDTQFSVFYAATYFRTCHIAVKLLPLFGPTLSFFGEKRHHLMSRYQAFISMAAGRLKVNLTDGVYFASCNGTAVCT